MTSVNTNSNPNSDQNYVPPGQSTVLTNTADTQTVQPGAGGGGATQVVPRDMLIQNVPPGLQGTTGSSGTTAEITPNMPLLIPGAITPNIDLGSEASHLLQSISTGFASLFGVSTTPTTDDTPAPMLPEFSDSLLSSFIPSSITSPEPGQTSSTQSTQSTQTTSSTTQTASMSDEQMAEVSDLHSATATTVFERLCKLAGVDPSEDTPVTQQLKSMASDIALKNTGGGLDGIDATTPEGVMKALQTIYQGNDTTVLAALTTISANIQGANINAAKDMDSIDSAVVLRVLQAKVNSSGGGDPPPSADTVKAVANALVLLAKALAFMSQLRATLGVMESSLASTEAQTKLSQLKDMTTLALQNYDKGLKKISDNAKKMHEAYAMQRLMKILGPIIAIFIAIITVILAVFSGGAGSALGIGLITATVALSALSVADSVGNVLDKLCDALKIKNDVLRSLFKMAVMVILVILTGGTAMFASAANMTGKLAMNLTANVTKGVVAGVVSTALTCLFSSGFLTSSFKAILMAAGVPEEKAAIGAMIMTFIVMIAALAAIIGVLTRSGAQIATKEATKTVDDQLKTGMDTADITLSQVKTGSSQPGEIVLDEGTDALKKTGDDIAKTGGMVDDVVVGTSDVVADNIVEQASLMKTIMNIGRNMKDSFKDPIAYLKFLNVLATLMEVASSIVSAKSNITQGNLSLSQAKLEKETSQLQAMLGYLQTLLPAFDTEIQKITDGMKEFAKSVGEMMEFYSQFIESLTQATTNAANKGV